MKLRCKKRVIAMVTAFCMMVFMAGCQKPFDASGYVKAVLDTMTKGEIQKYIELTGAKEEKANELYEDVLKEEMKPFETLGFSEELQTKYKEYMVNLLKKTKYEVKESEQQEDKSYKVDVEITPVKMFGGIESETKQKLQSYVQQVQDNIMKNQPAPSSEEMTRQIGQILYDSLNSALAALQYASKETITVHVQESKEKNIYEVKEKDMEKLIPALIDTTGIEEILQF